MLIVIAIFILISGILSITVAVWPAIVVLGALGTAADLGVRAHRNAVNWWYGKEVILNPPFSEEQWRRDVKVTGFSYDVVEDEHEDHNTYKVRLRGSVRNDSKWVVENVQYRCNWKDSWHKRREGLAGSAHINLQPGQETTWSYEFRIDYIYGDLDKRALTYHDCMVTNLARLVPLGG